ncbi:MAG: hypothetical protein KF708_15260 [Pirellulales bacterium]|nr:hypothetical protein [Pirellulales bacterium]
MSRPSMHERDPVDLFYGEANAALARVYVRLSDAISPRLDGATLSGTIAGPHCLYARTLPSQFRLMSGTPGGETLAEAVVTDPCFWSPLEPYRYTARITIDDGSGSHALSDLVFGIRRLGVRGKRLYFEGKNWVARIVTCREPDLEQLPRWREVGATLLVDRPDDEFCEGASQIGVLLMARVAGDEATIVRELRRLTRHAAVGIALVEPTGRIEGDLRDACRNVLLAAVANEETAVIPSTWAHVMLFDVEKALSIARLAADCTLPVFIRRKLAPASDSSLEGARAACDGLQADLTGQCEAAAFCV